MAMDKGRRERALESEGYTVIDSVLSDADIQSLRGRFPSGDEAGRTVHIDDPDFSAEAESRIMRHADVREFLEALLGREFRLGRIHGREPGKGGGAQGLHADANVPLERSAPTAGTLIVFLDDADVSNGSTRFIPGSHRWRKLPNRREADPAFVHQNEICVAVRAGDAVLFNAHTWHSATRNTTGRRRRALQCSFERSTSD